MGSSQGDLDALLDDALTAFDQPAPRGEALAAPAAAPAAQAPSSSAAAATSSATPQGRARAAERPAGSGQAPAGLGFDALARRPRPARAAAPRAAGGGSGGGPVGGGGPEIAEQPGPSVDVLAEGLSQLLAELAQAEAEEGPQAAEPGSSAAASTSGGGGPPPGGRDMAATLRALSEQAPSFAAAAGEGGGGGSGSEEELLRLLAGHMGDLGGGGNPGGGDGGGGGGPPGMASLVDSLMQQLLSKEVLYQPMKDIGERYPSWLAANRDRLSAEEYEQYQRQHGFITAICTLYEQTPNDFGRLVDLLQQMQQCGQPPQEIVDELAPGMQFGPDGLPTFGGGGGDEALPPELKDCIIQ